jgi:hypothetical protein
LILLSFLHPSSKGRTLNILHYITGLAVEVVKVGNCGRTVVQDVHTLGPAVGRVARVCFTTCVLQL